MDIEAAQSLVDQVEDTALGQLQGETNLALTSPALPGQRILLEIRHIAPSGSPPEHTFPVQLAPREPVPALRPGLSG